MPDPNNIALREHGIVFMLIPKVACTSIKIALCKALGKDTSKPNRPDLFEYVGKDEAREFPHRIAFVREPLARLASCYRDKILCDVDGRWIDTFERWGLTRGMDFQAFLEAIAWVPDDQAVNAGQHFRQQAYDLCDGDQIIPNVLGRFETLAEDWARVQDYVWFHSWLELPDLTHERRTDPSTTEYTPRGRALALQRYRDDVRIFGYQPPRKHEIDPDSITVGRSICNVLRETYQIARDEVPSGASARLCDLIAEAFDMGKRMNAKLRGSQYAA